MSKKGHKVIISGGGTGGHVFPAIAIANAVKALAPDTEFLFVGAHGKIEMEKVPAAGYPIEGLWVSGFQRSLSLRNLAFPFKLGASLLRAWWIVRRFKPDVAVGVGGYASGPTLEMATRRGVPALIQEQNSYAGVTNKLLARKAAKICVAYPNMERFFPAEKLVYTGNPVRQDLSITGIEATTARLHYGLQPNTPTLLIVGGSLGAKAINEAVAAQTDFLKAHPEIQVLWQVGKGYYDLYSHCEAAQLPNVKVVAFLERMDYAYAAATVIACRAGALTISELSVLGIPAILVPAPQLAEDHQTHNAAAMANKQAAILLHQKDIAELLPRALKLMNNPEQQDLLRQNSLKMAKPQAAQDIARVVLQLAETKNAKKG